MTEPTLSPRVQALVAKLQKGIGKSLGLFKGLGPQQWQTVVYSDPIPWTVRDLLAHFLAAEEGLLELAQDVAGGGPGAPMGFDYDAQNALDQERLAGVVPDQLMDSLVIAREATVAWVRTLRDDQLTLEGVHPGLGPVTLETMITAIYGHQLLHMRDLMRAL